MFDEWSPSAISPTIYLNRGEPVAITVVNRLRELTMVHWHGIELESFFDGVGHFAGSGSHTAPVIGPGDSFVARFAPPRGGTFIYHARVEEPRQHRAGLVGALIVRDSAPATAEDVVFVVKTPRTGAIPLPNEVNGSPNPDTTVLRLGTRYRLRFVYIPVVNGQAAIAITSRSDSSFLGPGQDSLVQWRPWAKDGADLPPAERKLRPARQNVTIGETHDFEFIPDRRGDLRIEVRSMPAMQRGRLTVRIPIRVE